MKHNSNSADDRAFKKLFQGVRDQVSDTEVVAPNKVTHVDVDQNSGVRIFVQAALVMVEAFTVHFEASPKALGYGIVPLPFGEDGSLMPFVIMNKAEIPDTLNHLVFERWYGVSAGQVSQGPFKINGIHENTRTYNASASTCPGSGASGNLDSAS